MKKFLIVLLSLVAFSPLFAQNNQPQTQTATVPSNTQEVVVKLQQMAPPPPPQTLPQKANEWVDFGKNVGTAMDAGLTSLTDHADKFSKTDAGRFTMAIIAWKVAGRDAMDLTQYVTTKAIKIFFGIPVLIAWNCLAIWFFRRIFLPRQVLVSREGPFWARKKTWQVVNNDNRWTDGKIGSSYVTCAVWVIVSLVILFNVIL